MAYQSPTFFGVAYASRLFREVSETGQVLKEFRRETGRALNLSTENHIDALLRWLNNWGCRITRTKFPSISDALSKWNGTWNEKLPTANLEILADRDLSVFADAYECLLGIEEFGPTSASKVLFALYPRAAIPWDAAIQSEFDLIGRAPENYRKMLVRSRHEIQSLISDAAICGVADSETIPKQVDSIALTLPELLDEYHWITITRRHQIPDGEVLSRWIGWTCWKAKP